MKTKLLIIFLVLIGVSSYAQFTTGTVALTGASRTIKIDTNATTVTLTLTGSSTAWLGLGFGGSSMSSVTDMFIWNSTSDRDYTPSGGQSAPSSAETQNWTTSSENIVGSVVTVVATRALATAGDYAFINDASSISIIFAEGSTPNLGYHGSNPHAGQTLSRSALGVIDFSLNASEIYPNPSKGEFIVKTKTFLQKINIYSQTGALVRTIEVNESNESVKVNSNGVQAGVYLLELVNEKDKAWKKIIITE